MLGLTTLGLFHTAIGLVAVLSGIIAFVRDREISPHNGVGQIYIWATVVTCVTAFGIFQHGGFGKPHMLAVLTLLVLALAALAGRMKVMGRASKYVETIAYSATFLFHMIPALTETFTRLPAGAPLFANADDPGLQKVTGVFLLLFVIGATLQVRRIRATRRALVAPAAAL